MKFVNSNMQNQSNRLINKLLKAALDKYVKFKHSLRLGVGGKLTAAMAFIGLLSVILAGIATRITFERGFTDYLNERGIQQMDSIEPKLTERFQTEGSWQFLLRSPIEWFNIIGYPANNSDVPPIGTPIPINQTHLDESGSGLRLALFDKEGKFIIGFLENRDSAVRRAIKIDNEVVGWLTYTPSESIVSQAELAFKQRQDRSIFIIGLISVFIAAAVAMLISRRLISSLKPIRQVVAELASGNLQARLNLQSDDEIGDLSADINHLANALDKNERVRRNLMADLSHELRTPIAILQAELEAMRDGIRTLSQDSLRSLYAEVRTLSVLVDDVYEVTSSDVGALNYRMQSVDVLDVLEYTLHAFEKRRQQREITLRYTSAGSEGLINGDEGRLNQLFNNLIENSMRYTYAGGELKIQTYIRDRVIEIIFWDSEPGIEGTTYEAIFERSFQGRQRLDTGRKGNGLGLTICQNIIDAHRGEISAGPSPLGGLCINIKLPRIDL
ncbi:HAMP domain-containing protein [Aestuariibacter sp. GS-14]|uniref:ATP-binding protein n=1 Tax=Aestuariibacter sp. GS-14 TaxID=2590670 RepID=UPI00112EC1E6|nr:ATP-binding protein [Aestuariibacter sp. GS-14]TPV60886.1 HAMP domain-containing protein [Aestuariibacter sp. GS-14]